jgi:pyrroline-5-carboxylate reductase
MHDPMIALIGAGNMGSSLIGGLIQHGYPPENIIASDHSQEKLAQLRQQFSIQISADNINAAKMADVIIFAVKPYILGKVVQELTDIIQAKQPLLISIAAGVRTNMLANWVHGKVAIVRAMPNTPALLNCGITALYATRLVTEQNKAIAERILGAVGKIVWVADESQMDTVTALSGSGPAYFFLIMEALQAAAESLGLPQDMARTLTIETAYGAAMMAKHDKHSLAELRAHVTSPGGTTEKALSVLEEQNIRGILHQALTAAKERSEALAESLGKES